MSSFIEQRYNQKSWGSVSVGDLPIGAQFTLIRSNASGKKRFPVTYTITAHDERRGVRFVRVHSDYQGNGTFVADYEISCDAVMAK